MTPDVSDLTVPLALSAVGVGVGGLSSSSSFGHPQMKMAKPISMMVVNRLNIVVLGWHEQKKGVRESDSGGENAACNKSNKNPVRNQPGETSQKTRGARAVMLAPP
jgi:hypothetical protein